MTKSNRLVIAENLVRVYREVLDEPVPAELAALLKRLEAHEEALR